MNPTSSRVLTAQEKEGAIARLGISLANWSEKWFPDAFVFAAVAVLIVSVGALAMGRTPTQVSVDFGKSFWNLIPFTMQMAFVVIGGYVVAISKPVHKFILVLAKFPKTPRGAIAYVGFMAMLTSLLSWGFSMIFAGILMREISKRLQGVDYRAISAAGFLGLGTIWALGLSSSAALMMATKGSIPPALLKISGVIPLELTLFTWQNLVMILTPLVICTWICYSSAPAAHLAKTFDTVDLKQQESGDGIGVAKTPGESLEFSPILTLVLVALGLIYLADTFATKGGLAALDLNTYNFMFIVAGLLLHWRPRAFLRAVAKAVPMTGGVLIQFPLYAGIFGVLMGSGINEVLAKFFVSISTQGTLPAVVGVYSAILGLFLPSGGGKWVVEAPYLLQAATELKVNLAWVVQCYNASEALPNFINPFWMLPLMGLVGVKARELAGYTMLQLIFMAPITIFMLWLLSKTMPFVAPVLT
jgi:short-chain fatty acids transporter